MSTQTQYAEGQEVTLLPGACIGGLTLRTAQRGTIIHIQSDGAVFVVKFGERGHIAYVGADGIEPLAEIEVEQKTEIAPLHVTTFTGKVFIQERIVTTAYALTDVYLQALESVAQGASIPAAVNSEFERVGIIGAGKVTPLGYEVMREVGMSVIEPLTPPTVYEQAVAAHTAAIDDALSAWRAWDCHPSSAQAKAHYEACRERVSLLAKACAREVSVGI